MKIPVFVSCATSLSPRQEAIRESILKQLDSLNLEPRALGRSDYPTDLPLREVYTIAKHCSGGIILGFEQFVTNNGIEKKGTKKEKVISTERKFPTEWNNLEAGIIFSLGLPMLIFREVGILGGVFDYGVTDVFVHNMSDEFDADSSVREVFLKWRDKVGKKYYG